MFSDHENLKTFISTKALNYHQARWAKLLVNYDFVLISIPGTKNPANEPSHRLNYAQDISISTSSVILQGTLRLLPSFLTECSSSLTISNVLFASLTGMATVIAPEADM